jgi:WD40 repeat protein
VRPRIFLSTHPFTNELLGDDSKVIVWSVASGEKLFVAQRPFDGAATAVSWVSRDNSRFVVGFASGDLHLFSSESGKVM